MEHYKYNMAECCHAGMWQEDILGKTCLDCGFNTYHNDCGMYDNPEPKGMLNRIKEAMHTDNGIKAVIIGFPDLTGKMRFTNGRTDLFDNIKVVEPQAHEGWDLFMQKMKESGFHPPEFLGPKHGFKYPERKIKPEVFEIVAPPRIDETLFLENTDPLKLDGTKRKKTRKGNNKKYFRRKRK